MGILAALRAREPRTAALILAVCAVVVAGLTIVQESDAGLLVTVVSWTVIAVVAGLALACGVLDPARLDRAGAYPFVGLLLLALICTLNLMTRDPSAAGQAATDVTFFGAVLVVMAGMLWRAGIVQDRLVGVLQEQAAVDSLTGLVNRRVFDGAPEDALTRPTDGGTALALIDVDAFKAINDSHGHPVGDDVLVHLADVLRANVRADDAVLSRPGGDELAVLLPGRLPTSPPGARRSCSRRCGPPRSLLPTAASCPSR